MNPAPIDAPRWRIHGERTVYDSQWVQVTQVEVTAPDDRRWWHHVVRLQTVAAALVVDERDRVLMLGRHRFIPDTLGWELPGGIVGPGESGQQAARREAEEETGWRPLGEGEHLVSFQPMPGLVDTPHEVYLFRGAQRVGEPADAEEAGPLRWVALAEMPELIRRGAVAGSGSLVGLLYLLASGGLEH